jgi:hypothetical protein
MKTDDKRPPYSLTEAEIIYENETVFHVCKACKEARSKNWFWKPLFPNLPLWDKFLINNRFKFNPTNRKPRPRRACAKLHKLKMVAWLEVLVTLCLVQQLIVWQFTLIEDNHEGIQCFDKYVLDSDWVSFFDRLLKRLVC